MQLGALTSRMTPRGWLILGGSAIGAILFIYLFLGMVSKPTYSTLATGLEPGQTGKMTSVLDQHGIHYELQNNGTALAVQSNETSQARVALGGSGLLGNSQPGFSLFEKSSLGESNFQQQVTYQRALQGQLAQTIDNIQGVSGAQVELVLPSAQSQVFGESQNASLGGRAADRHNVNRPGIGAWHRTARGLFRSRASSFRKSRSPTARVRSYGPRRTAKARRAQPANRPPKNATTARWRRSSTRSSPRRSAPDKAEVQVYATLNTNQTTQESLEYGKSVPTQQTKNVETLAGGGGAAGGTAGAATPAAEKTAGTSNSNYKHEVTSSSLGVSRTVTHSTIAPGTIESQHVSVLLDKHGPRRRRCRRSKKRSPTRPASRQNAATRSRSAR